MIEETHSKDERYRMEARIGSGAMATVYRAYDQRLHRIVALKILHSHLNSNLELRLRFEQEAKLAARIDHPNVVRIYDIATNSQQQSFIVSEFVDGCSLSLAMRQYMNRGQPCLNPLLAALVSHEIARGVDAAHQHSVVHRDLKPDNVLVSQNGEVKLTDFGVARPFDSSMTQAGQFIGSLTYASPEQVRGAQIDARSDIFSFGVIMFELLTGQLPFRSTNPTDLAFKITQAHIPPLNQIRPAVPLELDAIVRKCLRADPADRPQQAEHLVREIAVFLNRQDIQVTPQVIRDGFENPTLFTSTIRRSPLMEITQTESNVATSDIQQTQTIVSLPLSNELETNTEKKNSTPLGEENTTDNRAIPDDAPHARPTPPQRESIKRKAQRPVSPPARPSLKANRQPSSSWPWSTLLLVLAVVVAFVVTAQREDISTAVQRLRERTHTPQPTPTRSAAPSATPTPIQTRIADKPTFDTRPLQPVSKPEKSPSPVVTMARTPTPAPTKNKVVSVPTRKPKEMVKSPPSTTTPVMPSLDNRLRVNETRKSALQIQVSPGPRTIEIIRGNRKEFLGLSSTNSGARVFDALEPGSVTLYIPTEQVEGRRYEGVRQRLVLEPGKTLTLPPLNPRILTNVTVRCPAEVSITKVNGKKILHRGGPLSVESPLPGVLELEMLGKAGQKGISRFEIRTEGQIVGCQADIKRDR